MANWLGVAATRAAWEAKVETSSQRLMLLAIARYADDSGEAFPSVDTICEDTCLSKNTAFKVLKELKCLGLVSVEKRQNNANQYTVSVDFSDDSYTKSGTTKIGTTKIDTTSTTNIGMTVVPKLVQEEKQEESKEENIFCDTASFESVSQSAADFGFDGIEDEGAAVEAPKAEPKPEPKKAAKKLKAVAHAFDLEGLPPEWHEVAKVVAPNLDAVRVFAAFKFYWQNGRGAGTLRSDKGWSTTWMNWVKKDAERSYQRPVPSQPTMNSRAVDPGEYLANLRRQRLGR